MIVYHIVNEYKVLDDVLAITLSNSRNNEKKDFFYDIEIDIILKKEIDFSKREYILKKLSDTIETVQGKYGDKDIFILRNSTVQVVISYLTVDKLENNLINVVEKYEAAEGDTTYLWKKVKNAFVAYDRNNVFKTLQDKYNVDYPDKLKLNIINKNYHLLKNSFFSYYNQIGKAISRGDIEGLNNKINKFLGSYFDIIFALNKVKHPGGKKVIDIINTKCHKKPVNIDENIDGLLESVTACDDSILEKIDNIIDELKKLLEEEKLI